MSSTRPNTFGILERIDGSRGTEHKRPRSPRLLAIQHNSPSEASLLPPSGLAWSVLRGQPGEMARVNGRRAPGWAR